jgi:hypothetical protein
VRTLGCVFLVLFVAACGRRPSSDRIDVKTSLLPEAAAQDKAFSDYQPAKPYIAGENGVLVRTVFQADGGTGYGVEVRDWKVPAGRQTDSTTLLGAAFIEVRSGSGTLDITGKKQELGLGRIVSISQDQAFIIANTGQFELTLRVYVVAAR